jgi:flagellar biosynthesis/type III secretory pathway protein FliH
LAEQLNLLDWRTYLKYPNPVASAFMAKMKIDRKDPVKVKLACLKMVTGLKLNPAQKRLLTGFIDTYLKLNQLESESFTVELAKEPAPQQEKIMELTTSWKEEGILIGRAEGIQVGKAEGKAEGIQEGKREMLLELLTYRFGELKETVKKQGTALSEEKTEALAKATFGFNNLADLTKWLKENKS